MFRRLLLASTLALFVACEQPSEVPSEPAAVPATPDSLLEQYANEVPPLSPDWTGVSKWTAHRGSLEATEAALLKEHERGGSQAVWAELGKIYTDVGEYDRALWFLCRALEADPKDIESWLSLGQHRLALLKPEEALVLMERVRELNPDHPFGWVYRGDAHFNLHELEPAEEAYREAVLLSPRNLTAQLGLARVYESWNEPERAREHLERALRLDPDHPTALFRLARVLRELGLQDEAAEIMIQYERAAILEDRRLRTSQLSSAAKYLIVADSFFADGRIDDAGREYQNARDAARVDDEELQAVAGLLRCARSDASAADSEQLESDLRALDPTHTLLKP